MTQDIITLINTYSARSDARLTVVESEVSQIKQVLLSIAQTASGLQNPTPTLPPVEAPLLLPAAQLHFGLDPQLRPHWLDVYSRLVSAHKLRMCEVSGTNFTWLLCGSGTPPQGKIRWYGSTRELAYAVRQHLNSRWDIALNAFNDKNDRPLPKTFKNTKPPTGENMEKIDLIFRKKD